MCRLLETIKCKDGKLFNLEYHQKRLDESRRKLFGCTDSLRLSDAIEVSPEFRTGLFRCRIIYNQSIQKVEFIPHQFRKIERIKLVYSDQTDYSHKFADRLELDFLFEKRGDCDDIIIVKNGCITDSYTANPIFFDGKIWWTPDTPLLQGTQRARLLEEGKIRECRITPDNLDRYQITGFINAMQDMGNMPVIPVSRIL